jgi:hypothetical protein
VWNAKPISRARVPDKTIIWAFRVRAALIIEIKTIGRRAIFEIDISAQRSSPENARKFRMGMLD